jgi:polyisoprenoid-binding protein YceI
MKQLLILSTALCLHTITYAQNWSVDKLYSSLKFSVTHLKIAELDGRFKEFEAKITSAKDNFSDATFEVTAGITSLDTDNDKRDELLRSADFFNAAKFPKLSFISTNLTEVTGKPKTFKLVGNLTLHGVTKPVTLELVFNGTLVDPVSKRTTAGFQVSGTIKRSDFGIGPSMPVMVVSDEVKIKADGEFTKY